MPLAFLPTRPVTTNVNIIFYLSWIYILNWFIYQPLLESIEHPPMNFISSQWQMAALCSYCFSLYLCHCWRYFSTGPATDWSWGIKNTSLKKAQTPRWMIVSFVLFYIVQQVIFLSETCSAYLLFKKKKKKTIIPFFPPLLQNTINENSVFSYSVINLVYYRHGHSSPLNRLSSTRRG